jgi:spore coat polysaccharide biosynthesis predicted glycosyltransferase SpsG
MIKKNIIFKCEADDGKHAGTGHLKRSIKLLNLIQKKFKKKYDYIFILKKLDNTEKIIKKLCVVNYILYKNNLKKKLKFLNQNDIVINDTPRGLGSDFSKILEKKKIKKIIVLDCIKKYKQHKNITYINSISSFKKKIKGDNVFQGEKYLLLNQNKKNTINKFYKNNNNLKILISSGGSDYKNILYKITSLLLNIKNVKLTVIIGPGIKKNNPIFSLKGNITKINNIKNIEKLLKNTDISIVTGGLTMFESLALKKITYVYQSYFHQSYAVNELVKKKLISRIGLYDNVFKNKLLSLISKNIDEMKKKKIIINNIKSNIDTNGYYRVKKIIYKFINDEKN